MDRRMIINHAGAIKFNNYDSTNNTGTPTYMLGTDGSGNVVKVLGADIPGVPAGSGTLNTVAMWTPDGDTLGNAPITISGNNSTFAGKVQAGNNTATNWFQGVSATKRFTQLLQQVYYYKLLEQLKMIMIRKIG